MTPDPVVLGATAAPDVTAAAPRCRRKYGADWDRYTTTVKYLFIPGVYWTRTDAVAVSRGRGAAADSGR